MTSKPKVKFPIADNPLGGRHSGSPKLAGSQTRFFSFENGTRRLPCLATVPVSNSAGKGHCERCDRKEGDERIDQPNPQ
jgi:hypothetical protein